MSGPQPVVSGTRSSRSSSRALLSPRRSKLTATKREQQKRGRRAARAERAPLTDVAMMGKFGFRVGALVAVPPVLRRHRQHLESRIYSSTEQQMCMPVVWETNAEVSSSK